MARKTSRAFATATAVALALGLTACTGGGGASSGTAERIYIEAVSADPTGLNPQVAGGPIPLRFGFAILGTLVEINDQYEIMPGLAKEWDISPDGLTITLRLQENVLWHDGTAFTAQDVAFNFTDIMPLQTFGKPLSAAITSIDVPDDLTVVLHMARQYGPFLEALSQQAIVPKHLYEGTDYVTNPANMAPIGTGPMMFQSYSPGAEIILVKNPRWWRGDVAVDRAVYPIISDVNARTLSLLSGELDAAVIDPSQQDQVTASENIVLSERGVFRQMVAATFNGTLPQLSTPELRSLVFSAIDRDAVTTLGLHGLGEPATSFLPDTMSWAKSDKVDFDKSFPRDLRAIGAGLDSAGYPVKSDGWRFALDVTYISALSDVAAVAEVLKSSLADVGIQVNLVGVAEPVFLESVYKNSQFGISLLRNTVNADPSLGITRWLACNPNRTALTNGSGVCDDQIDSAIAGALATVDRDKRAVAFEAVQERAAKVMIWAPLSWSNGSNYTVNTSRWSGLADGTGQTNTPPWASMRWIGG